MPKWNGSALVTGGIYDSGSYIGINTNNPTNRLQIGSNPNGWNNNDFVVSNGNGGIAMHNNVGNSYIFTAQRLDLYGNGINTLSLSNGNVGISNAAPSAKLQIGTPTNATGAMSTTLSVYSANTLGSNIGSGQILASF